MNFYSNFKLNFHSKYYGILNNKSTIRLFTVDKLDLGKKGDEFYFKKIAIQEEDRT
jgi:hypothetical protein